MTVHKCDRCKKEVQCGLWLNEVIMGALIKTRYELCNECMKELGNFLNNKSVGDNNE